MARVERLGLSEEKALLALSSHALPSEKVQVQSSPPELAPVSKSSLKLDLPAPWYTSDKLASFSGQLFFLTPHHSATMALEAARVRLYEDQLILRTPRPKLSVGKISLPDHLGWRWFQCTKTLQILLPPDVGIRYSVFLKMEKQLLKRASSHTSIQLYNNARNDFITQCLHSKPNYPVRGISPSPHRYALEPGFKCTSIDDIVAKDERITDALCMTTFDSRLVRRSELGALGAQDDWGRSWVRLTENAQVLLPADTTYQYHEFIQNFILSHSPRSVWEIALANFSKTCQDRARYLDIYSGDRLYVLERDTSIPVLASLSGILRTHYLGLTERARSYAQSRSLDSLNLVISLSHHTPKLKPSSDSTIRLYSKRHKRSVCVLQFQPILEPVIEAELEDVAVEIESDVESGWDSGSSLDSEFSVTSTILGTSSSSSSPSPSPSPSCSAELGLGGFDMIGIGKDLESYDDDDASSVASSVSIGRRAMLFFLRNIH